MTRFVPVAWGNGPNRPLDDLASPGGEYAIVAGEFLPERKINMKILHRRKPRHRDRTPVSYDPPPKIPPVLKFRGKRPKTPRDPDPGDHGMWPDLWAEHRCGPHDHP